MPLSDQLQSVAGLHGLILAWETTRGVVQARYDYAVDLTALATAGEQPRLRAHVTVSAETEALLEVSAFAGIEATLNGRLVIPSDGCLEPYGNSRAIRLTAGENVLELAVDLTKASPRVSARLCRLDRLPLTGVTVSPTWDSTPEALRSDLPDAEAVSPWHRWNALCHRPVRLRLPEVSRQAWQDWRGRASEELQRLLGDTAVQRTVVRTLSSEQLQGMRRERLWFACENGGAFPAWALTPDRPNGAGILCLHGHGYKYGETVGVDGGDPEQTRVLQDHNYDYGLQLAKRGYTVLAPELSGFGARRDEEQFRRDPCDASFIRLALFGETLLGRQLRDLRTALAHLCDHEAVDEGRVGCVGLSTGGRMTMYLSAINERVRCAVASGCLNTFRERLTIDSSCGTQFVPGLLAALDTPEVFGLIAPRPLLLELGTNDGTSPEIFATEAYAEIGRLYQAAEARERLEIDIFESGHRFSGRKAFDWLERWLLG